MRKYIIGSIIGAALMFSVQAAADSWVGKEVQGTFPVYVNGTQLDTPAVVIDGNSFLPVRKISESVNYSVNFDATKKVVNLDNMNARLSLEELQKKLTNIEKTLKSRKGNIELWNLQIEKDNLSDEVKQGKLQRISSEQEIIATIEANKADVLQAIAEKQ